MRTYISLALLLTVLAVCHAKNLLVETEDEDMEPMIHVDPMPGSMEFFYPDIALEDLDLDEIEPKRRKNKSNKSNKRIPFEMHLKGKRG